MVDAAVVGPDGKDAVGQVVAGDGSGDAVGVDVAQEDPVAGEVLHGQAVEFEAGQSGAGGGDDTQTVRPGQAGAVENGAGGGAQGESVGVDGYGLVVHAGWYHHGAARWCCVDGRLDG